MLSTKLIHKSVSESICVLRYAVIAIVASCAGQFYESAVIDRMVVVSGRFAAASRGGCELEERKPALDLSDQQILCKHVEVKQLKPPCALQRVL